MKRPNIYKPTKPRSELTKLSAEHQQKLAEWLNSTLTYEEIKDKVEKEFKVRLKSTKALLDYRRRIMVPQLRQQHQLCPLNVPLDAWRLTLAEIEKALRDPKTKIEIRLRICTFLISLDRALAVRETLEAKARASKPSKTGVAAEDPNSLENANLEDIRHLLFGDSLDEKPATTKPPAETPPAA
jgi:hypothetical protein